MSDPIDWPADLTPQAGRFWYQANTVLSESPLSRRQQAVVRSGDRWVAQMSWQNASAETAARIEALLAQLQGPAGIVRLYDWRRRVPRGTAAAWPGGSTSVTWSPALAWSGPVVWNGYSPPSTPQLRLDAAIGATSLDTWGWAGSQTVLRAGDYLQLGDQLVMATADVLTPASGVVAVPIVPGLRAAAVAGTALVFGPARARFRLVDNDQAANDFQPGPFTSFSLSLVEAL